MVVQNKCVVVNRVQSFHVCFHVLIKECNAAWGHGLLCGSIHGDNEVDKVLKNHTLYISSMGCPPDTHKHNDHVDCANSSPLVSFEFPMCRATEVGGGFLNPRRDGDVSNVLTNLIQDIE